MTDNYEGLCSYKYDANFKEHQFQWLPWVGKDYDEHRILVLGSSHHARWEHEKLGPMPAEGPELVKYVDTVKGFIDEDPSFQRDLVHHHGIRGTETHKRWMHWNFSDSMLGMDECSETEREKLWSSVTFMNAIQETMIKDTSTWVNDDRGHKAWAKFKELVAIIKPTICIAWGSAVIDQWDYKENEVTVSWAEKFNVAHPKHADIEIDGHQLKLLAILHPSYRGFHRGKWADYLMATFPNEIGALRK